MTWKLEQQVRDRKVAGSKTLTAATSSSSFGSDLTSLLLATALGAALFPNIPMMPFCGLAGGLASPFRTVFFCSGSGAGARLTSLACCSSTDDMGTALAQRMALYLQPGSDRVLTVRALNRSFIETNVQGVCKAEVGKPAAVLQIVLHGVVVDAV